MEVSYCYHLEGTNGHDNATILIDTGSTVSVFKDEDMLVNIRNVIRVMKAITNGGHQDSKRKGILPGFFQVWVNPLLRMNVLSWKDVRKRYRIMADTAESNIITVHLTEQKSSHLMI